MSRCSFPQSRLLTSHADIDPRWMHSLFNFLDARQRTAAYSLAFVISFIPTHNLTVDELRNGDDRREIAAAFHASRELFDLMDDSLRNTDTLSAAELGRSRSFDEMDFARANDRYVSTFDASIAPILKRYRALFSQQPLVVPPYAEPQNDDTVGKFVKEFNTGETIGDTTPTTSTKQIITDLTFIREVLNRVNENGTITGGLRIPVNARCSNSVRRILLAPLDETIAQLEAIVLASGSRQTVASENALRQTGDLLVRPIDSVTIARDSDDSLTESSRAVAVVHPFDKPYTYLEAFASYAPILCRYDSLSDIMIQWHNDRLERRRRNVHTDAFEATVDDCGDSLKRILLPTRGVWQGGTSQILWIVLHTLAALTVERGNYYIQRMIVLLENLSFFIWCGECSIHWARNYGNEYFRHVGSMPLEILRKVPIDIVLLRCHNQVQANSGVVSNRGRTLSLWNLANLCIDYRDFVVRFLLRRGNEKTARNFRLMLCQPLFRSLKVTIDGGERQSISGTIENGGDTGDNLNLTTKPADISDSNDRAIASDEQYLTLALALEQDTRRERDSLADRRLVQVNALKDYYGNQLLRRLWYDVDPSMNIPICFMW